MAEISRTEFLRKQEKFSMFAMLKVEAAMLQSERNPKPPQTEPSSKADRGILLSALVAGLVKANAIA